MLKEAGNSMPWMPLYTTRTGTLTLVPWLPLSSSSCRGTNINHKKNEFLNYDIIIPGTEPYAAHVHVHCIEYYELSTMQHMYMYIV